MWRNSDGDDDREAYRDTIRSEDGTPRKRTNAGNSLSENNTSVIAHDDLSRRGLLASGTVLVTAASAGCLGNMLGGGSNNTSDRTNTPTSTPTPQASAIESYGTEGNHLVINVADDANITGFRLISPNGNDVIDTARLEGTDQAKLGLVQDGNPIPGGVYTILIYDGREVVNEVQIELRAKPEVVNVKLVAGSGNGPVPQATVTNTGRLPTPVQYVGFPDNVPSPKPVPDNFEDPLLGGMDRVDGSEDPLISKGEKGTFRSTNEPFYFDSNQRVSVPEEFTYDASAGEQQIRSEFCNGESVDTVLLVIVGGKRFEFPTTVTYGGEVEIQDALGGTFTCTNISANIQSANETASGNGTSGTTSG
jgi:hypothetical protein